MDYAKIAPIMGNLWSPLAAVSSHWRGQDNAQICVSIGGASIVAERPRVVTQIYKTNHSHEMIMSSGAFALNFPRADQLDWIDRFGMRSGRDGNKLEGLDYRAGETGSPLFADCWGWLDCRVVNAMDGGDMTCFLAEVVDGLTVSEGEPLWWRDARQRMAEEWMRAYGDKQTQEVAFSRAHMSNIVLTPPSWGMPLSNVSPPL
jgi:flavin reductase (DIM6/NTAB) family NADH-FMN oxidoreductase RutF